MKIKTEKEIAAMMRKLAYTFTDLSEQIETIEPGTPEHNAISKKQTWINGQRNALYWVLGGEISEE